MTDQPYTVTRSTSDDSADGRVTEGLRVFHATDNRPEGTVPAHMRTVGVLVADGTSHPLCPIDVLNLRDAIRPLPPVPETETDEDDAAPLVWVTEPEGITGADGVLAVGVLDGADEGTLTLALGDRSYITLSPAAQAQLAAMLTSSVADTLRG